MTANTVISEESGSAGSIVDITLFNAHSNPRIRINDGYIQYNGQILDGEKLRVRASSIGDWNEYMVKESPLSYSSSELEFSKPNSFGVEDTIELEVTGASSNGYSRYNLIKIFHN